MKAKDLDKLFDEGKDISEFIDYSKPLTEEEIFKFSEKKVTLLLKGELKEKLEEKSKNLGIKLNDLIKAILAKELGLI